LILFDLAHSWRAGSCEIRGRLVTGFLVVNVVWRLFHEAVKRVVGEMFVRWFIGAVML
jgi:hypothetical protein